MAVAGNSRITDKAWSLIAKACRWIGAIGAAGLLCLIGASLWYAHQVHEATACQEGSVPNNVVLSTADATGVRILGIQPNDVQLNHILCVRVDNVVTKAKRDELEANLLLAQKAVDTATGKSETAGQPHAPAIDPRIADALQSKAQTDLAAAKAAMQDALKPRVMVLYLNGKASPLTATASADWAPHTLTFEITAPDDANSADAAYWRSLLAEPTSEGRIPLRVGVAEQGAPPPVVNLTGVSGKTQSEALTFLLYTPRFMRLAAAAMVAIMLGLFGVAYSSTLLRMGGEGSAYSLSLVQMAIWLVLTSTGFVYIWLVAGQWQNVFSSGLFVLIGISGATATAARIMDRDQPAPASAGFFYDLVGNWQGGAVQLQRLQIIVWTAILALIFCWNVVAKLTLTSFDANLLILTGIANGVYVSLKPQEQKP